MARYQAVLAYDGTRFSGFQCQADARTVQGEIENALKQIGWRGRSILAAGRTDSGVHARGQVIAFDMEWAHAPHSLLKALNANLPVDIAVWQLQTANADFHPRFSAVARHYEYHLFCQPVRNPLRERYAWRLWPAPGIERMRTAARMLVGTHDFSAFGKAPMPDGTTVRTVFDAFWEEEATELVFHIVADAFLYHMVRRIVQLLVAIGSDKFSLERTAQEILSSYLEPGDSNPVQGLAPPQGLFLTGVQYAVQS